MALAAALVAALLLGGGFFAGAVYGTRRGRKLQCAENTMRDALEGASTQDLLDQLSGRELEDALPPRRKR